MARVERPDALDWRPKAGEIPTSPGVYRFRDGTGRVIYVGKAINLRQRLSNYFQPLRALHNRTRGMVTRARSVEWTVVGSDVEALHLEYTWIKEFDPPFNVKFRDDKSYPYMAVTLGDEAPRVMVTRNRRIPGARYFGPYPKIWALRETIDLMVQAFPIRTCNDASYKRAMQSGRACFLGQIGRCFGPCSQRVTIEEHRMIVDEFVAFMASHDRGVLGRLDKQMRAASAELDFERAGVIRDRIRALENVLEKSAVVLSDNADLDLFGIEHDELSAAVQQFIVRAGRVRGVRSWVVDTELDVSLGDLVDSVVESAYEGEAPPREIVVPALPDDAAALEQWLADRRDKGSVSLKVAQRGEKAALMRTAALNAKQALALHKLRRSADYVARTEALGDLQEALGLEEAPLRIEGYDISHLGGTDIVASMVVFEDGLPKKSDYRRFAIPEYADDTAAMAQVLRRRLARLDEDEAPGAADADDTTGSGDADDADPSAEGSVTTRRRRFAYRPGLIVVDGGPPQVASAVSVLEELGIDDIPVVGLAKRLEEVWLPGDEFPVILPRTSESLFLLQRLRDEAHRFAITYQRNKRSGGIRTVLSDIPGLGPTRVTQLLKHFGSVARLRSATPEELAEVKGVGPALASVIAARLNPNAEPDASVPDATSEGT